MPDARGGSASDTYCDMQYAPRPLIPTLRNLPEPVWRAVMLHLETRIRHSDPVPAHLTAAYLHAATHLAESLRRGRPN